MQHSHQDEKSFYSSQALVANDELLCHEQLRALIRSKLEQTEEAAPARKEQVTQLLKHVIEHVLGNINPVEAERIAATKRRHRA